MRLKLAVPLAQALIKAPQIAVLDVTALAATTKTPKTLIEGLREHCNTMTLFLLLENPSLAKDFPLRIVFDGPAAAIEERDQADGGM